MAVRDQVTKMDAFLAMDETITTDTTTNGSIIDTADYECGFSLFVVVSALTDGDYQLNLQEGDESDLSDAVSIAADKLIGTEPSVDAATAAGAVLEKVGVFSNKRYVRPQIVSTSTTSGATLQLIVVQHGEYLPI